MNHPFTGQELKQGGIQVAMDHANIRHEGWADDAHAALIKFLSLYNVPFLCETFRAYAEEFCGLPHPPSSRAYGGVMLRAKHLGLIEHAGITQVKNPRAHMANASLWVKAKG